MGQHKRVLRISLTFIENESLLDLCSGFLLQNLRRWLDLKLGLAPLPLGAHARCARSKTLH